MPRAYFEREFAMTSEFLSQNSLAIANFWNRKFSIFWRDAERFWKQLGLKQHFKLEFELENEFVLEFELKDEFVLEFESEIPFKKNSDYISDLTTSLLVTSWSLPGSLLGIFVVSYFFLSFFLSFFISLSVFSMSIDLSNQQFC